MAGRSGSSSVASQQDKEALATGPSSEAALEFQEMITAVEARKGERKVKTEEKRRETVELLEERRVRDEEEANFRLFRLPDSVWEQILIDVKDPKDLGSMWEVHPKFRQLSGESQSLEYLLSRVLSIKKLPHLWENEETWIAKLKMFRTFSKGMRISVDQLFDEEYMRILQDHRIDHSYKCLMFSVGNRNSWTRGHNLDGILADFSEGKMDSHTMPMRLPYRAIKLKYRQSISVTGQQSFHEFKNKVASLLERIGDQIWHLTFGFGYKDEDGSVQRWGLSINEVYIALHKWISLTPNLKMLGMDISDDLKGRKGVVSRRTFANYPFPRLNHLERVYLGMFPNVNTKIAVATAAIRPNLQIKTVDIVEKVETGDDRLFLTEMKPLLSMLSLKALVGSNYGWNHEWTLPMLEILQPVVCTQWNLRRFSGNVKGSLELGNVFQLIDKIKTLESLLLDLRKFTVGYEELQPINLPNLELFEMQVFIDSVNYSNVENVIFFTSLQFVFLCKKLKTLKWSFSFSDWRDSMKTFREFMLQNEGREMIKFKCGFQDLGKSNLWDVFPELEYVTTHVWSDDNRKKISRQVKKSKLL